jgi:dienelactone hydrolase
MNRTLSFAAMVGLVAPLLVALAWVRAADELAVLPETIDGGPAKKMLTRYLKEQAYAGLARRAAAYETIKTPEQFAAYQERLRAEFIEHLGGFPERTPLNARVVGGSEGDGFRHEKVIYESQPGHFVTAALFLPAASVKGPCPAVLVPCGHSADGKASNQRMCIFLAKHGIAAMTYDPIGQGERYQFLDESGKPRFRSTTEHTLVGAGSIPLGRGTATYRIWDGIRSLDYLAERKEIDASRIGVTGCSGGGTLTSYLMALDDRVACAAPSCYITSFRRLIDTIGPQDAEQNIHGQLAFGLDHADYILLRAPRPTLVLASTMDFFDIEGTWNTFRQAKRMYTRLGFAERVDLVETDAKHGYPQPQREAMVRWMRRWLAGIDEPVTEPAFDTLPAAEVLCTPRGQVMLLQGARNVADLNVELDKKYEPIRRETWRPDNRQIALAEVRRLAGIRPMAELPTAKVVASGTLERGKHRVEKLVISPEPGIMLPALLFRPARPTGGRYLYVHGEGKQAAAAPGGEIEKLADAGHTVFAIDLRGMGETGNGGDGQWGGDWTDSFLSYLVGRPLVGMRAEDLLAATRYLAELSGPPKGKVNVVAVGTAGPAALHAVALESDRFASLRLAPMPRSWSEVVRRPEEGGALAHTVHGALKAYDLADLAASLPAGILQSNGKP